MNIRRARPQRRFFSIWCLAAWNVIFAQAAGLHAPQLPSNHALIITVSEYQRSPLPGVLNDRKLANELAQRFGVPAQNIVELSERDVTREGLKQALGALNQVIMPGDKLYVYFSGHGARFFSKASGQCTESIVMQDMHVVTNTEFANMLKPLSAKTDKTIVMLDSCHSGGVAHAASARDIASGTALRAKFLPEASSPQCSLAVNDRSFSQTRGADLDTTDNNLVILAAARNNEVAWDTSKGGALTYNFQQCLNGGAADADHSGSLSMRELTACIQARLDKTQQESARQHATLAGNAALVPSFVDEASGAAVSAPSDPLATLNDIYNQRDDRWEVQAKLSQPALKIGTHLAMSVRSQRDGFVYMFYQGTEPGSFYLLFPNQLDSNNAIAANQELQLPRPDWNVTALGPHGTDHLMVMVTATARDFSTLALPAEYVSASGPFEKIRPTTQAAAHIGQIATLSAAAGKAACRSAADKRDLGVARECSNVFGASLVSVEEVD
ncbi:MAG TPA: caspase family protein [Steroidobacteraceae bacterium]|nr:caspase family protein [Steroidobacteraceae bacterium]